MPIRGWKAALKRFTIRLDERLRILAADFCR